MIRSIARIVFGYRDDLDLSGRWWHRLATVLFVLSFLVVMGIATMIAREDVAKRVEVSEVDILTTMNEVMLRDEKADRTSYISDFQAIAGENGIRSGKYIQLAYFHGVKCFIFKLVENADGTKVDPPVPESICFEESKPSRVTINATDMVKYQLTSRGIWRIWFVSLIMGHFWAAGLSVPFLNLYYRGLVYIICGQRKKPGMLPAA